MWGPCLWIGHFLNPKTVAQTEALWAGKVLIPLRTNCWVFQDGIQFAIEWLVDLGIVSYQSLSVGFFC